MCVCVCVWAPLSQVTSLIYKAGALSQVTSPFAPKKPISKTLNPKVMLEVRSSPSTSDLAEGVQGSVLYPLSRELESNQFVKARFWQGRCPVTGTQNPEPSWAGTEKEGERQRVRERYRERRFARLSRRLRSPLASIRNPKSETPTLRLGPRNQI